MKKKIIFAVIFGALFAALIVLVKKFDVAEIGPAGTSIGCSHINKIVHDLTGVNMMWYNVTDLIGYGAIGVCMIFAIAGLVQLIRRRSLVKVDGEILALGVLFAVVIGLYVFFEKFIINYRPIIMPDAAEPEASFPSSHTMLICVVMGAVCMIIGRYVHSGALAAIIRIICVLIILVTVGGRLYCGVHWFTDIVGGVLLSAALLLIFSAVVSEIPERGSGAGGGTYDDRGSGSGGRVSISDRDRVINGYVCKH